MSKILATFRSRSETLSFASIVKSYGVMVEIVSTPRSCNVTCGISAKFDSYFVEEAKEILSRRNFTTFAGLYLILENNYSKEITVVPY
ncbi:MAG: putative Se/S carrier-like protein [Clostridia bacterium]